MSTNLLWLWSAVLLLLLLGSAVARPALVLESAAARVALTPAWALDEARDCFGTVCAHERVYNIFLGQPPASAAGTPYCTWAQTLVDAAAQNTSAVWTPVAGENVELRAEALLGALFGGACRDGALRAAAAALVRVNGAAPERAVHVNVVEQRTTPSDAGALLCYRAPRQCEAAAAGGEQVTVNVFVAQWCASGCLQSRASPPQCTRFGCDGAHGQCVGDDECVCAAGYAGASCATRAGCATTGCSERGQCNALTGQCACAAGFAGAACERAVTTTRAAATPPPASLPGGARAVGTPIAVDQAWLQPFSVFPAGNFTHFGVLSFDQLPRRTNAQQSARAPLLEQPFDATTRVDAQGYVAVRADYERRELFFELAFSVPRGSLHTGSSGPSARLFEGELGKTGDELASLDGGYWCRIPSWVSLDWEAWKLNGTVSFDGQSADAVAAQLRASAAYVVLSTPDRPAGALRAQLIQFDAALTAPLSGPDADTQGAGLFLLDEASNTLQFWVYYTAPLDYIERGATINVGADDRSVHPLSVGTVGLRRIGEYRSGDAQPMTVVCALSKFGVWRIDESVYGADIAARLRSGEFAIDIASFDNARALGGAIAE